MPGAREQASLLAGLFPFGEAALHSQWIVSVHDPCRCSLFYPSQPLPVAVALLLYSKIDPVYSVRQWILLGPGSQASQRAQAPGQAAFRLELRFEEGMPRRQPAASTTSPPRARPDQRRK